MCGAACKRAVRCLVCAGQLHVPAVQGAAAAAPVAPSCAFSSYLTQHRHKSSTPYNADRPGLISPAPYLFPELRMPKGAPAGQAPCCFASHFAPTPAVLRPRDVPTCRWLGDNPPHPQPVLFPTLARPALPIPRLVFPCVQAPFAHRFSTGACILPCVPTCMVAAAGCIVVLFWRPARPLS